MKPSCSLPPSPSPWPGQPAAFAAAPDDGKPSVKDLDTVTVSAQLDQARNALSPDIGSSQYQITAEDIQKQPLGALCAAEPGAAAGRAWSGFLRRRARARRPANLQYRINGVLLPESISGFGQTWMPARSRASA